MFDAGSNPCSRLGPSPDLSRNRKSKVVLHIDANGDYQARLLFEHRELVRGVILSILH